MTFPLGLLLYGWNDWADYETDRRNPRKGNLLFGAKLPREALATLPWRIAFVQLPFFAAFTWLIGPRFLLWIAAALAVNACYNLPQVNFKGRPILDALNQSDYLLVFVLASWANHVPQLPWPIFLFGLLFAMHSQLLAEITDIRPDRAAGRHTTAVTIGAARTKLVVAAMLACEAIVVALSVGERFSSDYADYAKWVATEFLGIAALGFVADYGVRGDQTINDRHLAGVLIVWNMVALASMYFVWNAGLFAL